MLVPLIIAISACGAVEAAFSAPVSVPAAQDSPAPGAATPEVLKLGTFEIGLLAGYGSGTVTDRERTPTQFGQVLARFALYFGSTGSGALRGNFSLVAEGVGMSIDQDPRATGGGLNLLIRYTWAAGRWRPMFFAGAGVLYTDEQVPPGETKRNFTPQGGIGLQYLVADQVALGGEYRFHHLSNKGETETNPGINTHLVLFGVTWFH